MHSVELKKNILLHTWPGARGSIFAFLDPFFSNGHSKQFVPHAEPNWCHVHSRKTVQLLASGSHLPGCSLRSHPATSNGLSGLSLIPDFPFARTQIGYSCTSTHQSLGKKAAAQPSRAAAQSGVPPWRTHKPQRNNTKLPESKA
jgi:hypothetical protein